MSNASDEPRIEPFAAPQAQDETNAPGSELRMHSDELGIVVLCHLSTLVPLWALIANALLLFFYRESSRTICFHARQGIHLQVLLLLVSVAMSLAIPLQKLLLLAQAPRFLTAHLPTLSYSAAAAVALAYAACCLIGVAQALRGRVFVYPIVGKTLYRAYRQAPSESAR